MSRIPNTLLQQLLQEAEWGPRELARALGKVAVEQKLGLTCHHTTVQRWLNGTQPRPPFPVLLLECLSRRLGRRVTVREAGLTRAPGTLVDPLWEADPVRKLTHLVHAEVDPNQRALLVADAVALTTAVLQPPPTPIRIAGAVGGRSHCLLAARLHSMADVFAPAADQHGGRHLRPALASYLIHNVVPRLRGLDGAAVCTDMLSASAQLTLLLGGMCADAGHDAAAQHYHQIAARLAADAGDRTTLAIALRTMAAHAHNLGHHAPAVLHLAEQADEHARLSAQAVRAFTRSQLAVLLAHHDRRAALAALSQSEQLHAAAGAEPVPGPFSSYPAAALQYQRAQVLLSLGDHKGALAALTASLRLRSVLERLPGALTRAQLAETHLRLGHLDQALHHWGLFLEDYPALTSARADKCLTVIRQTLRPHQRYRGASDVLDRVRELTGRPC
ncbi:tol-pal system YbgF family protein [Streptomyces lavendulae]|uniref:tol-pal system YbgF family protein n=1 Tax=Streptomyces lavendulae TaxID=1914 RepID=UPI00380CAACA